jgi:hypothetical protein
VEKQRDKEQKSQINVDIAPISFGQPPQFPVCPVGHTSLGYNVQDNAGNQHNDKSEPCRQRRYLSDSHLFSFSIFLPESCMKIGTTLKMQPDFNAK